LIFTIIKKSHEDIEILLLNLLNINLSKVHLSIFGIATMIFLKAYSRLEIDAYKIRMSSLGIRFHSSSVKFHNALEFLFPFQVIQRRRWHMGLGTILHESFIRIIKPYQPGFQKCLISREVQLFWTFDQRSIAISFSAPHFITEKTPYFIVLQTRFSCNIFKYIQIQINIAFFYNTLWTF